MRHHPAHDLSRTYRCVSILLGRAALRADQHVHLLFPPVMRVQCAKALWHMPPGNPAFTTLPKIGTNPTHDRRTNMVSGPAPGETQRPWGRAAEALVGLCRPTHNLRGSRRRSKICVTRSTCIAGCAQAQIVLVPVAVPSSIVGAGLPGLVAARVGFSSRRARGLKVRRRKKEPS